MERDVLNEMKDLMTSPGWESLCERLKQRREMFLRNLLTSSDIHVIARSQAQIAELDLVMKLPHDIVQDEKRKEPA